MEYTVVLNKQFLNENASEVVVKGDRFYEEDGYLIFKTVELEVARFAIGSWKYVRTNG